MDTRDPYCRGFRFDKNMRLATDNVTGYVQQGDYNPVPPPVADFFLLLDGTNFLLLDGSNFLLLS